MRRRTALPSLGKDASKQRGRIGLQVRGQISLLLRYRFVSYSRGWVLRSTQVPTRRCANITQVALPWAPGTRKHDIDATGARLRRSESCCVKHLPSLIVRLHTSFLVRHCLSFSFAEQTPLRTVGIFTPHWNATASPLILTEYIPFLCIRSVVTSIVMGTAGMHCDCTSKYCICTYVFIYSLNKHWFCIAFHRTRTFSLMEQGIYFRKAMEVPFLNQNLLIASLHSHVRHSCISFYCCCFFHFSRVTFVRDSGSFLIYSCTAFSVSDPTDFVHHFTFCTTAAFCIILCIRPAPRTFHSSIPVFCVRHFLATLSFLTSSAVPYILTAHA